MIANLQHRLILPLAIALSAAIAHAYPAWNTATTHEVDGNVFHYVIPNGWQALETASGVQLIAPDGTASFGLMLFPIQDQTLDHALRTILQNWNPPNLRILQTNLAQNPQNITATISFDMPDGGGGRGLASLTQLQTPDGPWAIFVYAMCPADQFQTQVQTLMYLAHQIVLKDTPTTDPVAPITPAPAPSPDPIPDPTPTPPPDATPDPTPTPTPDPDPTPTPAPDPAPDPTPDPSDILRNDKGRPLFQPERSILPTLARKYPQNCFF